MAKTNTQKAKAPTPDAPTRSVYEVKVRIDRVVDYENSRVKAIASANIGPFAVHGIRVIEGQKGLFVQMPQNSYTKDGKTQYSDIFHPTTSEARTELYNKVLNAYQQLENSQAASQFEELGGPDADMPDFGQTM